MTQLQFKTCNYCINCRDLITSPNDYVTQTTLGNYRKKTGNATIGLNTYTLRPKNCFTTVQLKTSLL